MKPVRLQRRVQTPGEQLLLLAEASFATAIDAERLWGELRFIGEMAGVVQRNELATALVNYILLPPSADAVRPQAQSATVSLGSAKITKQASDLRLVTEEKFFGLVEIVFETKACGLYRERIFAGAQLPAHVHQSIDESELVLGSGLHLQGRPVAAGMAHDWPRNLAHRYDNPTCIEQSFLCIDRPAFIPSDETFVAVEVGDLAMIRGRRYF